jgi:transposase-like protein
MFTGKEDMEATALREQGWSISAIARHLGRSRETVRSWVAQAEIDAGRRAELTTEEPAELVALRKENRVATSSTPMTRPCVRESSFSRHLSGGSSVSPEWPETPKKVTERGMRLRYDLEKEVADSRA